MVLFERCFKRKILGVLYPLSTASEAAGYRTSTGLRMHKSFNIRNGKEAACDKTKPPERVGPPGWALPFHSRYCSWKYEQEKYTGSNWVRFCPAFPSVPIPLTLLSPGRPNFSWALGWGPSTPRAPPIPRPASAAPERPLPGRHTFLPTATPRHSGN